MENPERDGDTRPFTGYSSKYYGHLVLCLVTQSCPTLCDSMDGSPPGSSGHGIFQARILERVAISYSRDLPHPGIEPVFPGFPASQALAGRFFTTVQPGYCDYCQFG